MHRDVGRFIAFDFVLRLVFTGVIWSNVPDELRKQIETDQTQIS